jgi:hypothetical protein
MNFKRKKLHNMFDIAEKEGCRVIFIGNKRRTSAIYRDTNEIVIGLNEDFGKVLDYEFLALAHEIGHLLSKENRYSIEDEIRAWKVAFEQFLTVNPEIRLSAYRFIQRCLNNYVGHYIYGKRIPLSEKEEW